MDLLTAAKAACLLAALTSLLACTSASEPAPGRVAHAQPRRAAEHTHADGKLQAPVDLKLETSGTAQRLVATLTFTATAEIPRAVVRFVPPPGAKLLQGDLETDLGHLDAGQRRQVSVALSMDALRGDLAAGVDAHLTPNSRLHKGAVLTLGAQPPQDATQRRTLPGGQEVRTQTVK